MPASGTTENIVGACTFWAYIVAALVFTGIICNDLITLHHASLEVKLSKQKSAPRSTGRHDKAKVFFALSLLSFSVLSYHMLSFLIQSYSGWVQVQHAELPQKFFGEQGLFNLRQGTLEIQPWRWSKASTLFQDFASVICNDPRRFWWTQQALLYSFGWNMYMSIKGKQYQIPHLWMYFVLDQILPVSFTQNLFCAALALADHSNSDQDIVSPPQPSRPGIASIYLLSVLTAPLLVNTSWFFVVLFTTRALLFAPFLNLTAATAIKGTTKTIVRPQSYFHQNRVFFILSLLLHLYQTWKAAPLSSAVRAIHDSPAVATLGYDYVIAAASLLVNIVTAS